MGSQSRPTTLSLVYMYPMLVQVVISSRSLPSQHKSENLRPATLVSSSGSHHRFQLDGGQPGAIAPWVLNAYQMVNPVTSHSSLSAESGATLEQETPQERVMLSWPPPRPFHSVTFKPQDESRLRPPSPILCASPPPNLPYPSCARSPFAPRPRTSSLIRRNLRDYCHILNVALPCGGPPARKQ